MAPTVRATSLSRWAPMFSTMSVMVSGLNPVASVLSEYRPGRIAENRYRPSASATTERATPESGLVNESVAWRRARRVGDGRAAWILDHTGDIRIDCADAPTANSKASDAKITNDVQRFSVNIRIPPNIEVDLPLGYGVLTNNHTKCAGFPAVRFRAFYMLRRTPGRRAQRGILRARHVQSHPDLRDRRHV